ncbi:sugar phosphate isomerase/epimerase family protein [Mucilaginibacter ginsenosidivorax]|uniref:Sugar phosphate isomerase/epimerase n=1 Tax=Mucilaginibacter ginsenosidivorax TaxID=862126 RepID=A0A5B8W8G7_9SPHI|nr:sugar phosphate isomerase/epimerase [Mucilaginibacter ginsenosidivorax]QEC79839.1 sugar phosphate isomerase/epimerase [Mucilaginibacter ginsenosidivorax]
MKIKFFCPRWGSEQLSWDNFCLKVKEAGYHGIESPLPFNGPEKSIILNAIKKHDLLFIGQYYQSFEEDFELHKINFRRHLENVAEAGPLLIDSQTGKDYFTSEQNRELFIIADEIAVSSGVTIAHETHRNKALFAAHVAKQLLTNNPDVLITADFSHWCNVSESLLEQQAGAVNVAISRTIHIHARVGHAESAQVSDPAAPEWHAELEAHLQWWDAIVNSRLQNGAELLTITPEFGPHPYMPALPYTKMPVANQWNINVWMMDLLKKRYREYLA